MQQKITLELVEELEARKVYNVFLNGEDTNFIGCEIFEDGTTKRYPFSEKNECIVQRYKSIRCITTTNNRRPKGCFYTNVSKGFGFTSRKVSALFDYFQEKLPRVNEIVFIVKGSTEIKDRKLFITIADFNKLKREIKLFEKKQR